MAIRSLQSQSALTAKLARFAGVGALATGLYVAVAWVAVEAFGLAPLPASLFGYVAAIGVSYLGQKRLTFRSAGAHRIELPRFLATSVLAFAGSVGSMAAVTGAGWDYRFGLVAAALAVPLASFAAMNFWVFRRQRHDAPASPIPEGAGRASRPPS